MDLVTDTERAQIAEAAQMIMDARALRNRVMARIRKRKQRAKEKDAKA